MMNLSKHVKVTRTEWEDWRDYLQELGYSLVEHPDQEFERMHVTVYEGEQKSADLGLSKIRVNGRWCYFFTVRVPRATQESEMGDDGVLIDDLEMRITTYNILRNLGINTIGELREAEIDWEGQKGLGPVGLKELTNLASGHYRFRKKRQPRKILE